ncbi:jg25402 [Pararge aegeria aegeria]|uniref:Jg25402 protein n=1 Tax=Pararge aegeria aegeria TaxID=348720 RepID=A0A8S4QTM2_9NEOP|nr:jg25402 [Pararge aegeria aegeria]
MSRVYEEFDPAFASVCSDVTVYSNNKGFFKSLAEEIVSLAEVDGWLQTFEDIEDEKKVTMVMENNTVSNLKLRYSS